MKLEDHPTVQRIRLKTIPSVPPKKESLDVDCALKESHFRGVRRSQLELPTESNGHHDEGARITWRQSTGIRIAHEHTGRVRLQQRLARDGGVEIELVAGRAKSKAAINVLHDVGREAPAPGRFRAMQRT